MGMAPKRGRWGSVDDLVTGIVKLLESNHAYPVNPGNPEEATVLDLARMILRITGSNSQIRFVDRPQDDPTVRQPDIGRTKTILKWEPKVDLEGALQSTVAWTATQLDVAWPRAASAGSEGQLPD